MRDLDGLVRYETESSAVDFKAKQYIKAKHHDFLTDVIAMANADVEGDRYIVLGVKLKPDGTRLFLGISQDDFVDASIYQQLIRENVEPELQIDYEPVKIDAKLLGVLRIYGCHNRPYMMKKDRPPLRQGDAFIRKGTHQPRLLRADLDRIYAGKMNPDLASSLLVSLAPDRPASELGVHAMPDIELPSARAAAQIRKILGERKAQHATGPSLAEKLVSGFTHSLRVGVPYHQRDTPTLESNLANIEETYREDDLYTFYEVGSHKLQIHLFNGGERYIEDASLTVSIPAHDDLFISDRVHSEPQRHPGFALPVPGNLWANQGYPGVERGVDSWTITASVGHIRHGIWEPAFDEPLRVAFGRGMIGQIVELDCRVHAKNLPEPVGTSLKLVIAPSESS